MSILYDVRNHVFSHNRKKSTALKCIKLSCISSLWKLIDHKLNIISFQKSDTIRRNNSKQISILSTFCKTQTSKTIKPYSYAKKYNRKYYT